MTKIWLGDHAFKKAIEALIRQHFTDSIAKNFEFIFEVDMFNKDANPNLQKQLKDNSLILEVRYKSSKDTVEYVCDVYSWESRAQTEYRLLQGITDKVRDGKLGKDWHEEGGRIGVSNEILSGKYETIGE